MKFKHITIAANGGRYLVTSNHGGLVLGEINYYAKWKCYVFEPDEYTIYSTDCLEDIIKFMKSIKAEPEAKDDE